MSAKVHADRLGWQQMGLGKWLDPEISESSDLIHGFCVGGAPLKEIDHSGHAVKRACIPMLACLSVLPSHYEVSGSPSPQTSLKMLCLTASPDTMATVTTRQRKPASCQVIFTGMCHRNDNPPQVLVSFFKMAYIVAPWLILDSSAANF